MMNLLYFLVFLFICFECETQPLYSCSNCNCFLKSPCVDNPNAYTKCLTNTTQISCYDSTITSCLYGCGVNSDDTERCLCPRNCTGHGYCSSGSCSCDSGYFGAYCDQTDFCFDKNDGLHCDPNNSTQMIGCYNQRIDTYYPCKNCTYDAINDRGYCNCPNDCSGNGTCQQISDALGVCDCYGNYMGAGCTTEYTTCPQQFPATTCSGKTLVKCSGGAVQSSIECTSACNTTGVSTAECSCGAGCGTQGTCVDPGVCKCFLGYTGPTCTDVTVCTGLTTASYVCINSTTVGYCSNYVLSSYTLDCPGGCTFGSCLCDSTTCLNGYCLSTGECNCYSGWNGTKCDIKTTTSPGTPLPATNATATFCATKVTGNYCNGDNLVLCSDGTFVRSTPCQYGCNSTLWGGSHTCHTIKCPPGYFGSACEHSDPCTNGTTTGFTKDYCVGNYVVNCNPTNTTSRIFCTNGCTGSVVNGRSIATCNCNCGPQGKDCDIYGNCECKTGWLACPSGFSGDNCAVALNPCAGSSQTLCQASNSSLLFCYNGIVSASTKCSAGCSGNGCACENNCSGNGFCGPNGACFCRTGYAGNDCSQALECTGKPNGFVCDSEGQNLLTCMRDRVLYNSSCAGGCVDGACKCQNDCSGQGTCQQGVCLCNNGFIGDSCEIYLDSDIASVFIIIIAVGLAASVGYALIIFFKTKVENPEVEMETLRAKNRPDRGRLTISRKATTALKLDK